MIQHNNLFLARTFLFFTILSLLGLTYFLNGNHLRILQEWDEKNVVRTILDEIPTFTIQSLHLIADGDDYLVADVNNAWIFRFARQQTSLYPLEREKLLLAKLHEHISMPIPSYEFHGKHTAFVGYRKIPGEPLLRTSLQGGALYSTFSPAEQQAIAESLALFFTQLHHAISIDDALALGYKPPIMQYHLIEYSLLETLPPEKEDVERIIREALGYVREHGDQAPLVLLHNDLHGGNCTFDMQAKKITGILDFSDATLGNYYADFGKLFSIHHDLAMRTVQAYAALNGIADFVMLAAADRILQQAGCVLQFRSKGNLLQELNHIHKIQEFVPIWDALASQSQASIKNPS